MLRPRLRVELLGQLHRALHVGEEHGDLLALAFEGGLRIEDLVGEVFGVRCGAFNASGDPGGDPAPPGGWHWGRNRRLSALSAPHAAHGTGSGAAQCVQKRAPAGLSLPAVGQIDGTAGVGARMLSQSDLLQQCREARIGPPTRRARDRPSTTRRNTVLLLRLRQRRQASSACPSPTCRRPETPRRQTRCGCARA